MLVVFLVVGCVHTSVKSSINRLNTTHGDDVPEEIAKEIGNNLPKFYSKIETEVGSNANVKFKYWDKKGKPYNDTVSPKSTFVLNGFTRQAATMGVIKGILNSGVGIFSSAVQGYYGRKTQDLDIDTTGASATASADPVQNN